MRFVLLACLLLCLPAPAQVYKWTDDQGIVHYSDQLPVDGVNKGGVVIDKQGRLLGINDRAELAQAEWDLRTRINSAHMRAGVTMRDPSTVYLDWGVELATDVHDTLEEVDVRDGQALCLARAQTDAERRS